MSFGGTIATRYAATYPNRVSALVLVSVPGPSWTPNPRQARYIERPWSSVAAFCATSINRLGAEIYEAYRAGRRGSVSPRAMSRARADIADAAGVWPDGSGS